MHRCKAAIRAAFSRLGKIIRDHKLATVTIVIFVIWLVTPSLNRLYWHDYSLLLDADELCIYQSGVLLCTIEDPAELLFDGNVRIHTFSRRYLGILVVPIIGGPWELEALYRLEWRADGRRLCTIRMMTPKDPEDSETKDLSGFALFGDQYVIMREGILFFSFGDEFCETLSEAMQAATQGASTALRG